MGVTLKDLIVEFVLAAFDRFMDWITRGKWELRRGAISPNIWVKGK